MLLCMVIVCVLLKIHDCYFLDNTRYWLSVRQYLSELSSNMTVGIVALRGSVVFTKQMLVC